MRKFKRFNAASVADPNVRTAFEALDVAVTELNAALAKVSQGSKPDSTGTPLVHQQSAFSAEAIADFAILSDTNIFTADQSIQGDLSVVQLIASDSVTGRQLIVVDGTGTATFDGSGLTDQRGYDLPDASGMLLVDAPSDGNKYCRKDGAWVVV